MWAALKSDLTEFVSTVADESSNVLANIDDKLTDDDGVRESTAQENGGMVIGENGDVEFAAGGFEETGVVASAKDEAARLMGHPETFLIPLEPEKDDDEEGEHIMDGDGMDDAYYVELKDFLADWDVEQKTDEIAKLLEEHPQTLKVQFEELVPTQIKYEDFWQRYFFRCNEERITKNWEMEQERKREARSRAISGGITAAKNLFGGAVKALKETTTNAAATAAAEDEPPPYPYAPQQASESGGGSVAGLGASLFGGGGRPPFVMNTAVDEDEDDDEVAEEEEEEEELGWDDDDEDFDTDDDEKEANENGGDEEDMDDDDDDEVIDFSNSQLDDLKQQYAQAVEERDSLHETVEMQKNVIMELQAGKTDALPDADSGSPPIVNEEEMEKMKLELFEKNAELAAIKANLEDDGGNVQQAAQEMATKVAEQQAQLTRLTEDLLAKELELTQAQETVATMHEKMDQPRAQAEDDLKESESKRLADMEQLQTQLEAAKTEIARLQSQSQTEMTDLDSKMQEQVMTLTGELTKARQDLEESATEMEQLRKQSENSQVELEEAREKLERNQMELTQTQEQITQAANKMGELLAQAQADKAEVDKLRSQSEADKQTMAEVQGQNSELQSALGDLQATLQTIQAEKDTLQAEKDSLHGALAATKAESATGNAETQQALVQTQAQVEALTKELEEAKASLEFTTRRADNLDGELRKTQQAFTEKEAEFSSRLETEIAKAHAEATPHDCTSSESTGVRVPPVLESAPVVTKVEAVVTKMEDDDDDDDDGDGWGDDWSDDDI
eukprot:CAMPEP_0195282316 /NCGR_PEP_ID=MMETSP0707-20130614/1240_1 /TAXON_ID=33640 /ORGANISM="Asterionellopsis glacialis, Strain CCMP134" /LENGTH=790 /DNA_ID=CAMNT_0040341275 /DNA_START=226 /DNA_END=2598 /DNA_ORIENTATION=+